MPVTEWLWDKLVEWRSKDTYFNLDLLNGLYECKKHRQIILQELRHYIDCAYAEWIKKSFILSI